MPITLRMLSALALLSLTLIISGCWDRVEIENRGLVLGIGIDYAAPPPRGGYDLPHVTQEAGQRKYRITFEMPKLRKEEGEKASGASQHYIFSGEGESIMEISRSIGAKTYFSPFFEDTQIMIFSKVVAQQDIGDLLDFFLRNPGMRRQVKLFVTPGRAEDILRGQLDVAEVNSMFIAKIVHNEKVIPRFASVISLGDVSEAIQEHRSFAMAEILLEHGHVKLTKGEVFNKDRKLVGELNEQDVLGAKILKKVLKGGSISIPNPANPDKIATFEVLEPRVKITSLITDNRPSFSLEAVFVGNLVENAEPEQDALDPAFQQAAEQAFAEEFTNQVKAAYHKQQQLKAEVVDLGVLLHRQHPHYWETVKDRWDEEVFPATPLDVKIKVIIRRPGMIR